MNNDKLFEYLVSSWEALEAPDYVDADVKALNYLYFATQLERRSIHATEKSLYGNLLGLPIVQQNLRTILMLCFRGFISFNSRHLLNNHY